MSDSPVDVRVPWHARSGAEAVAAFDSDADRGLTSVEAESRLEAHGANTVGEAEEEPWWEEALESIREPLQLVLLAVGAAYFVLGEIADGITILAVILAVSSIEVVNELRAKRALAALRSMASPTATVTRGGAPTEIPGTEVVPGDVVLLSSGRRAPADLRLLASAALRVDESALTGESVPVAKAADAVLSADTPLADRQTMVYNGTLVTAGKGSGVVVSTGEGTELGRIAALAAEVEETPTPLQRGMRQLSGWLVWLALGLSVLVPLLGVVIARLPVREMLLTGLTLAFATIPEELPILITIVLGIGAFRLARRGAIVKGLQTAETLGSVSVVATDKTGTLTENRMRMAEVAVDGRSLTPEDAIGLTVGRRLLQVAVLANEAQQAQVDGKVTFVGDPTETALLAGAEDAGLSVEEIRMGVELLAEHPFDDRRKRMSVVATKAGWPHVLLAVKGAPETILSQCTSVGQADGDQHLTPETIELVRFHAEKMAARGLRVLAFAERPMDDEATPEEGEAESGLTLLGMAGLEDPPRPEAPATVDELRHAGVRVLMLTGDHSRTAAAIADRVGIPTDGIVEGGDLDRLSDDQLAELLSTRSVFARITPEHKLRVVQALQGNGEIVAVTGDGVNDAPALRQAAIGVAMGQTGTDVAREAADLVLADDNLATVTAAVRTGRRLYANLRKAVRFYLAVKVGLVGTSLAAVLLSLPIPFSPIQIILMELFMDLGASTTFVAEPPEEDLMARPPRNPRLLFMDRAMTFGIFAGGLSLGMTVFVVYLWAWSLDLGQVQSQTAAFVAWMTANIVLAAHMRSERTPLRSTLLSNRNYLIWAAATIVLVVAGLTVPFLQDRLHLSGLSNSVWIVLIPASLLIPSWWAPWKRHLRGRQQPDDTG